MQSDLLKISDYNTNNLHKKRDKIIFLSLFYYNKIHIVPILIGHREL